MEVNVKYLRQTGSSLEIENFSLPRLLFMNSFICITRIYAHVIRRCITRNLNVVLAGEI